MENFKPVTHVIFDCDGLVLDTESIYWEMYLKICKKYNRTLSESIKEVLIGRPEMVNFEAIVDDAKLPIDANQFKTELFEISKQVLPNCTILPGVERLLNHLHKHKIPIAMATSSSKEGMELKMRNYKELFCLFDHIVMGSSDSEVKFGKPHPDIFLICASRFPDKPDPQKCLVFEDAPSGVQGAISAGMQVVMVPDPHLDKNLTKQATIVLKSLNDFKPESFGLPKF